MRTWFLAVSLLALLISAGAPFFVSQSAKAATLGIFESVEGSFGAGPQIFKSQRAAQSFNASMNYRLVRVQAVLYDLDPSNPLTLTIQTDAAGVPSGTSLASAVGDGASGYDWVAFDLNQTVDLTQGQRYWLVLEDIVGMNNPDGYIWGARSPDLYPDRYFATSTGGGGWQPFTWGDLLFRNWGLMGPQVAAGISADTATAGILDPVTYTVYLNNTGTGDASYVWANMTLSANMTYLADTAATAGGIPLGPLSWQFMDVSVGPHRFAIDVRVNVGIFDGLLMTATVQIDYANETEVSQERTTASATVIARTPAITIAKSVAPGFLGPGENLTYGITVTNSGSRASPWVWVNDTVPAEVNYFGNTASALPNYASESFDGTTLRVLFTDLPKGAFAFNISAQTKPGLSNGTAFTNTVIVDYADSRGLRAASSPAASATARIHGASIEVAKSANVGTASPREEIRYRIRYDNRGNAAARWVWINDTLPPELTYVSDTGGGVVSGSVVGFLFQDVSVGVHSFFLTARVLDGMPDGRLVQNTVDLSHTDSDGTLAPPSFAVADVLLERPIVSLAIAGVPSADPGDLWTVDVAVSNRGNATSAAVWVNLTVPVEVSRVSDTAVAVGGSLTTAGWSFADVAPGSFAFSVVFRIQAALANGTSLQVVMDASYLDGPDFVSQAPRAVQPVVIVAPSFTLALRLASTVVSLGESVVLTVDYANVGAGVSSDVWINVTVPDGVEIANASEAWIATTGLTYTWHPRNVAPGAQMLRVTLRPSSGTAPGVIPLSVRIAYTDANGNLAGSRLEYASFRATSVSASLQSWGLLVLLATVAILSTFIGHRMYGVGSRSKAEIQQMFVLHKSGLLIKHYTRHLHGALDTDILAAMIVAVQNFVRESFQFKAGDLEEMTFGEHKILLVHGHHIILAAVVSGGNLERMKIVLRRGTEFLEANFADRLTDWSGVVEDLRGVDEVLDQILRGRAPVRNGKNGRNGGHGGALERTPKAGRWWAK